MKKKIFPWTCMTCGFVMAKAKGSKERMCKCESPKAPTKEEINMSPWKRD